MQLLLKCINGLSSCLDRLTLQIRDNEVVVEFDSSMLLHLVLQLEDGFFHVGNLRVLLLQLGALLRQNTLLLR